MVACRIDAHALAGPPAGMQDMGGMQGFKSGTVSGTGLAEGNPEDPFDPDGRSA